MQREEYNQRLTEKKNWLITRRLRANNWQGAGQYAGDAGQDRKCQNLQAEENTMDMCDSKGGRLWPWNAKPNESSQRDPISVLQIFFHLQISGFKTITNGSRENPTLPLEAISDLPLLTLTQYTALKYSFSYLEPVCFPCPVLTVASWPAYMLWTVVLEKTLESPLDCKEI